MSRYTLVLVGLLALVSIVQCRARCPWIPEDKCYSLSTLRICAFNIQVFGRAKMAKPHVVDILVRIINRYDVVLIQEIRDATGTAILDLLSQCNEASRGDPFQMVISDRLGRTSSREQYAYFYRPSVLRVLDTYQYPDVDDDFERPPYIVRFAAPNYDIQEFGYLGIHARPNDAPHEIDMMTDVYDEVADLWGLDDIILGGDFNAGCSYVRARDWPNIRLRTQSRFLWVIGDDVDTTPAVSRCPYDRFVLAGSELRRQYVQGSARPFYYDREWGIDRTTVLEVSDHYPIEMNIR